MNDIEKKFFETFGIEPKELEYPDNFKYYPEITDRILLELMEILLKQELQEFYYEDDMYLFTSKSQRAKRVTCNKCANLKELILHTAYTLGQFTPLKDRLTKPIKSLFMVEEE